MTHVIPDLYHTMSVGLKFYFAREPKRISTHPILFDDLSVAFNYMTFASIPRRSDILLETFTCVIFTKSHIPCHYPPLSPFKERIVINPHISSIPKPRINHYLSDVVHIGILPAQLGAYDAPD